MKNIVFTLKNGTKTTGLKFSDELVQLTVKGILDGEDLEFKYHDGTEVIIKAEDIASFEVVL
ncbi:hypothetical protein [Paenibacillus vini]|uniref:Uncharacterized protein n=1 Tax=Paenibacillus vini TaxID=1476024 RepID=A0ABQ4M8A7_9BACL|nr:hypothetical protein [Paenibacillus vini]GIP52205.1 hypothetical protein J42TS3_12400 [Paenibacillus vini]